MLSPPNNNPNHGAYRSNTKESLIKVLRSIQPPEGNKDVERTGYARQYGFVNTHCILVGHCLEDKTLFIKVQDLVYNHIASCV
jgi:hypothetical protein